jgi:hypothetical protein
MMKIARPFLAAAIGALALAGQALATPKLWVVSPTSRVGAAAPVSVITRQDAKNGRTTVFVPSGYRIPGGLNQRMRAGFGTADLLVREADGSTTSLDGTVSGVAPQTFADNACASDKAQHDAVWVVRAQRASDGAAVKLPVFVDHIVGGADAKFGDYKLQFCAGSATGLDVAGVDLKLTDVFVNPGSRGWYIWRARFDPLAADSKTIDPAASTSAHAVVPLNVQLTMTPKRVSGKHWVMFTGKLTAAQVAMGTVQVRVYAGRSARLRLDRPVATVRTNGQGVFRALFRLGKGTWYARGVATSPTRDITASGCAGPAAAEPVAGAQGCVSASLTPFSTSSRVYRLAL